MDEWQLFYSSLEQFDTRTLQDMDAIMTQRRNASILDGVVWAAYRMELVKRGAKVAPLSYVSD